MVLPAGSRTHTPHQGFHPSGSLRSARFLAWKPAITDRPIPLHSPITLSILVFRATGSSFQVRYVPSGSLFRKPLGTTSSMDQLPISVKSNIGFKRDFPKKILHLESIC